MNESIIRRIKRSRPRKIIKIEEHGGTDHHFPPKHSAPFILKLINHCFFHRKYRPSQKCGMKDDKTDD